MDINQVLKGKAIPLGVIIIIITYLVSGTSTSILPFVFFTGIIVGIIKNTDRIEAGVAGLITSFIGSIITTVISVALMYVSYGLTYVSYILGSSVFLIVFYIIAGAVGGVIGYYISQEIGE
ncbi:MAG: hypothetical protein BZ135_06835 [Methanosphaera sp. rholeuAM6]|nr:MAG: hypothetical protein BZ135_06835 [Methanosphaera sp. rholeuAM6]